MSARAVTYATLFSEGGCLSLLSREQDRKLRAAAWRHVRRINAKVARKIWIQRRQRLLLEAA